MAISVHICATACADGKPDADEKGDSDNDGVPDYKDHNEL